MNGKILVTPRSITREGHPALDRLTKAGYVPVFCTPGKQPDEEELIRLLPGCVGYLAGVERITARVIDAADSLRVISRNGTGVDAVDTAAASAKGIEVCRSLGANARGVAELAFGHLLSLARWIPFSDAGIKAGGWERRKGIELQGRTLGIIGCGAIGGMVAQFASAFGMRVLGHDPFPNAAMEKIPAFSFVSCDQALFSGDAVTLHCPMPADGTALIDAKVIAHMKRGVLIVNTARAGLVDTEAMLAALDSGAVAGLALDVFDPEPPVDRRLAGHSGVIATPHIGGFTDESVDRAVDVAVDNLFTALSARGSAI